MGSTAAADDLLQTALQWYRPDFQAPSEKSSGALLPTRATETYPSSRDIILSLQRASEGLAALVKAVPAFFIFHSHATPLILPALPIGSLKNRDVQEFAIDHDVNFSKSSSAVF